MLKDELNFRKVGKRPPADAVPEDVPQVNAQFARDLKRILINAEDLRGPRGMRGERGVDGRRGRRGNRGVNGVDGIEGTPGRQGERGVIGPIGLTGRQGERGPKGDTGATGPAPRHKWEGTKLSFENPDGTFGPLVNLKGDTGGRGMSAKGSSANPGFSSISLVGSNLVFARDTAGPLGPDITVDLSSLAGGGFAGLGPWRSRTETAAPPASGQIRFNNANPEAATELYVHETNDNAEDLANFLALLDAGDIIYIQNQSDAAQFIVVEISSNTDNGVYVTLGLANVAQQGGAISQNTVVGLVASIAGGGAGSVVTGLTTAADGDDITLTQTSGGNQVADTSDFLWKLGKVGGQTAAGGTAAADNLILRANTTLSGTGRIRLEQGAVIDRSLERGAAACLVMSDTYTQSAAFIGGGILSNGTINYANATWIWALVQESKSYIADVGPGFAAFTLFNALATIGNGIADALVQGIILNNGLSHRRLTAGTSTVTQTIGLANSPNTRAFAVGSIMTKTTGDTAVSHAPTFGSVSGSTVNFGTQRGLHCFNPAVGIFQPSAGAEGMTAYIGVEVAAISFGGNVTKRALRSAITAATNSLMIDNTGGAASDFGAGGIHFDDNAPVQYGGGAFNAQDVSTFWAPAGYWSLFFANNSDDLRFSNPANGNFLITSNTPASDSINIDVAKIAFLQSSAIGNQKVVFAVKAENITVAGEFSQYLLTQSATDTIQAALGLYAAWTLNAATPTVDGGGGGSLTTNVGLNIGGTPGAATVNRVGLRILSNPSGGSGINAALWITAGLSRFDGRVDINRPIALGGGAAPTLGTIGGAGPTAAAQAQWVEIDINGVAHWLPAWT